MKLRTTFPLIGLLCTSVAQAQSVEEKNCIFAAGQKLPLIPGLQVVGSRTKPFPEELQQKWKLERDRYIGSVSTSGGQRSNVAVSALIVDLDVKAAAQDGTMSFACFFAAGAPAMIYSIGLTR